MICPKAKERFQAYADGELAGPELMELEEHLASCEPCRKAAARRKGNSEFLRERLGLLEGKVDPDLGFLEALAAAPKRAAPTGRPDAAPARRIPLVAPALAVVVLLAVAGWWFFGRGGDGEPGPSEGTPGPESARTPVGEEDEPGAAGGTSTASGTKRPEPEPPVTREPYRPVPVRANVTMLLPQLEKDPSQLKLEKLWAAAKGEDGAAGKILAALSSAKGERERAVLTLALAGVGGDPEVRSRLAGLLATDASPRVRAAAAAALGHVPGGEQRVVVGDGLSVMAGAIEEEERRRNLVNSASSERDVSVLAVLIGILAPSQALDPDITARLVELTRFDEPQIQRAALESLRFARPRSVSEVMILVEDERLPMEARTRLLKLVPGIDREEGARALVGYLEQASDDAMKVAVLETLAADPSEETVAAATGILRSGESAPVRLAALAIVTAKPKEETRAVLEEIAEDADEAVREAARTALKALPKPPGTEEGPGEVPDVEER